MIICVTLQEVIAFTSVPGPNSKVPRNMRQTLMELKGEIVKHPIIVILSVPEIKSTIRPKNPHKK